MSQSKFLTAEWRKLAMANYVIDPSILQPFVPYGTELDFWNDRCYVSLVGFMFLNTKLKGIPIPFHTNFEEVNLRFYVRYQDHEESKRGVVFIKEIVPKPALSLVAQWVYNEPYETMPMKHQWETNGERLLVSYSWKKSNWNSLKVAASNKSVEMQVGSEEEFITEHFWGYTKLNDQSTAEYQVEHPRWSVYPVHQHEINVDFEKVYGENFSFLNDLKPVSVFLAEGSEIIVRSGKKLQ